MSDRPRILSLLRDERGSAMTEFVIGLPVYVLIFSGLGMLYRYNNEAMLARLEIIQSLSTRLAQQTTFQTTTPNGAGGSSATNLGQVNYAGSNGESMLADQHRKASIGSQFGTIKNPAAPPRSNLAGITNPGAEFTNNLLDETTTPLPPTEWASIIGGILGLAGTNPSIGAGLRYEPVTASGSRTFTHPWTGSTTYAPGTVDVSAPTASTHRVFSVAVARLEMNRRNPYRSAMLEFNIDMESNEMGAAQGSLPSGVNFSGQDQDRCAQEASQFEGCVQDPAMVTEASQNSCGPWYNTHTCNVAEWCVEIGASPSSDCVNMAQDTSMFENAICDEMPANGEPCARPNEGDVDEALDSINNLPSF